LDVSIPSESSSSSTKTPRTEPSRPQSRGSGQPRKVHIQDPKESLHRDSKERARTSLFTVKPGGIAGYLSSLCDLPSYVDITAKTDAYVGFLPSKSLEKLREARPIVLLTLAKRLISMLSPLGVSQSPFLVAFSQLFFFFSQAH
jgi:lysophospholipid hydrolase